MVFTKAQQDRARSKLIHDGKDPGLITPNDIDAECARMMAPSPKPGAKAPGKIPAKAPANIPAKALAMVAIQVPPADDPAAKAPVPAPAKAPAKKPRKKTAIEKKEESEADVEEEGEVEEEGDAEEKEEKRKKAKKGATQTLAGMNTRFGASMNSIRVRGYGKGVIAALGAHEDMDFRALKGLLRTVESGGMGSFKNRIWAAKRVYAEKWDTFMEVIDLMKAPGPFTIEGAVLTSEYAGLAMEIMAMAIVMAERGVGIHSFKVILQALLRTESDVIAMGVEKRLEETHSNSRVSAYLEETAHPRDENAKYTVSCDVAPLHGHTTVAVALAPTPAPTPAPDTIPAWLSTMMAFARGGGGSVLGGDFGGSMVEGSQLGDSASMVGGGGGRGQGGGFRGNARGRASFVSHQFKNASGGEWVPQWVPVPGQCLKCGGPHLAATCHLPVASQKCRGCAGMGHIAPNCPTNKRCDP